MSKLTVIIFASCIISFALTLTQTARQTEYPDKLLKRVAVTLWKYLYSGLYEKAIIHILKERQLSRRLDIAEAYNTLYGQNLVNDLKSELDIVKKIVSDVMIPLPDYYAKELYYAINGWGTDEEILMEILFTLSNKEISLTAASYKKLYGTSLESDIIDDTSGDFMLLLVSIVNGDRYENQSIDYDRVVADANALFTRDSGHWATFERRFLAILGTRSFEQLQQTFIEYKNISGRDIAEAIESIDFFRDFKTGLLELVKCAKSKVNYFAERLYDSIQGGLTNNRTVTRIIISRREIDLEDIKKEFKERYGKELKTMIDENTSGFYKECLLSLIST